MRLLFAFIFLLAAYTELRAEYVPKEGESKLLCIKKKFVGIQGNYQGKMSLEQNSFFLTINLKRQPGMVPFLPANPKKPQTLRYSGTLEDSTFPNFPYDETQNGYYFSNSRNLTFFYVSPSGNFISNLVAFELNSDEMSSFTYMGDCTSFK